MICREDKRFPETGILQSNPEWKSLKVYKPLQQALMQTSFRFYNDDIFFKKITYLCGKNVT